MTINDPAVQNWATLNCPELFTEQKRVFTGNNLFQPGSPFQKWPFAKVLASPASDARVSFALCKNIHEGDDRVDSSTIT